MWGNLLLLLLCFLFIYSFIIIKEYSINKFHHAGDKEPLARASNKIRVTKSGKNSFFTKKTLYISKTIEDMHIVTVED